MFDSIRCDHCVDMFNQCKHVAGEVAECGVAFGKTTFTLDRHVLEAGKTLYAFDTFSGMPFDDEITSEGTCKRGEFSEHGKKFFDTLKKREGSTSVIPVEGVIEDTLRRYADLKFCFVWLDVDIYQSTSFAYKFFEDRVSAGGVIGFHDYDFDRCPGVKKVVDEEVDREKYEVIFNEDKCYFIRRTNYV